MEQYSGLNIIIIIIRDTCVLVDSVFIFNLINLIYFSSFRICEPSKLSIVLELTLKRGLGLEGLFLFIF